MKTIREFINELDALAKLHGDAMEICMNDADTGETISPNPVARIYSGVVQWIEL